MAGTSTTLMRTGKRINTLLAIPEGRLRYAQIAHLTHNIEEIVVAEIENWQSVFGGKQIAVPV